MAWKRKGDNTGVADLIFRNGPYEGKGVGLPAGKTITVGRSREVELPLPDLKLSRRHCRIESGLNGFILRDLNSTNGTYLNGRRVEGEVQLRHEDRIVLGDMEIEFSCPEEAPDVETAVVPSSALVAETSAPPVAETPTQHAIAPANAVSGVGVETTPSLEVALQELILPLPSLAPGSGTAPSGASSSATMPFLCEGCREEIPAADVRNGTAGELNGKHYCQNCLPRMRAAASSAEADEIEEIESYEIVVETSDNPSGSSSPAAASGTAGSRSAPSGTAEAPFDDDMLEEIVPDDSTGS